MQKNEQNVRKTAKTSCETNKRFQRDTAVNKNRRGIFNDPSAFFGLKKTTS